MYITIKKILLHWSGKKLNDSSLSLPFFIATQKSHFKAVDTPYLGYPMLMLMPQRRHYPCRLAQHRGNTFQYISKYSVGKILKNGIE